MRIVACNDDEAMIVEVEHIVRLILTRVNEFGHSAFHRKLCSGKSLGRSQGEAAVDGSGLKDCYAEDKHNNKKMDFFHAVITLK